MVKKRNISSLMSKLERKTRKAHNSEGNSKAFKNRITTVWVMDMGNIDTETMEFWIENRKYI
jgi:hypothetical protein